MARIDHETTFYQIEVDGEMIQGHFKLERACGDLGYASTVFVVEVQGSGRIWPLSSVTCLYVNE